MTRPTVRGIFSSARCMEEAAYRLGLRELVVNRHSVLRRQDVHGDLLFFQKIQRLARHVKTLGYSSG